MARAGPGEAQRGKRKTVVVVILFLLSRGEGWVYCNAIPFVSLGMNGFTFKTLYPLWLQHLDSQCNCVAFPK